MKNMLGILLILFFLCITTIGFAQNTSIIGKWKTIDDETNEPKSIVKIYSENGKYFGQIIELIIKQGEDPDPVCDKCQDKDPRKGQPVKGMVIIKDLVEKNNEYEGGTILDPDNGKVYTCKIWVEDNKLMVRGYISFFFRTQSWYKIE